MTKKKNTTANQTPTPVRKRARRKRTAASPALTERQTKFVEHFALNGNASAAARAAGYAERHGQAGNEILRNPEIRDAISARHQHFIEMSDVKAKVVLGVLATQLTASIEDVLEPDGSFDYPKARARGTLHLLKSCERTERPVTLLGPDGLERSLEVKYKFQMYSAQDAAKQLCRIFGLEVDRKQNPRDIAERSIAQLIERAAQHGQIVTRAEAIARLADLIPEVALCAENDLIN